MGIEVLNNLFSHVSRGGGGGGGGLGTMLLQQMLQDKERDDARAYQEHWAEQYGNTINEALQSPAIANMQNMDPRTAASLQLLSSVAGSGNPLTLEGAVKAFEQQQDAFARGGVPSEKMREYQLVQQQGSPKTFEQYALEQRQGELPAAVLEAQILSDPNVPQEMKQNLLYTTKVNKDIENTREAAAAETLGHEAMKPIVKSVQEYPMVVKQYNHVLDATNGMLETIDKMKTLVKNNPTFAVGGAGKLLSYVPETDAKNFYTLRENLMSGVAMQGLEQLKSLSPTGASGFGALSEGELKVVQNTLAAIDQMNTPEQIMDAFNKLETALKKIQLDTRSSKASDDLWIKGNTEKYGLQDLAPKAPALRPEPTVQESFNANKNAVTGEKPQRKWTVVR